MRYYRCNGRNIFDCGPAVQPSSLAVAAYLEPETLICLTLSVDISSLDTITKTCILSWMDVTSDSVFFSVYFWSAWTNSSVWTGSSRLMKFANVANLTVLQTMARNTLNMSLTRSSSRSTHLSYTNRLNTNLVPSVAAKGAGWLTRPRLEGNGRKTFLWSCFRW